MTTNIVPLRRAAPPDLASRAAHRIRRLRCDLGLSREELVRQFPRVSLRTLQRIEGAHVALTQLELLAWLEAQAGEGKVAA